MHGSLLRMGRFKGYPIGGYHREMESLQKVDAADILRGSGGEGRSLREESYSTESVCKKPAYCIASAPSLLEFNHS